MRSEELGLIRVDCGDVACIPIAGLEGIAGRMGGVHTLGSLIESLNGVRIPGGDVRTLTACTADGGTYHAVAIGIDPTGLKSRKVGTLAGDGVAVARDDLIYLLEDCGVAGIGADDVDGLLEQCGGFECCFHADGGYGVDAMEHEGQEFTAIGLNKDIVRFLRDDELDFNEWYKQNPPPDDIGTGRDFNEAKWKAYADQHRELIRQG